MVPRLVTLLAFLLSIAAAAAWSSSVVTPAASQPLATTRAILGQPVAPVKQTPTPEGVPPGVEAGPFPISDGVEVVYYYFHEPVNDYDGPYLFGEMRNVASVPYEAPPLRFALLDAGGNILGTVGAQPLWKWIGPGETLPFAGRLDDAETPDSLEEVEGTQIEACFGGGPVESSEDDPSVLELRDVDEAGRDDDRLQVVGEVYNGGDVPAEPVAVKAAVYDGDGRYVGEVTDYLSVAVPSGKSARFQIDEGYDRISSFNPFDYGNGNHDYELSVGFDANIRVGCG